MFGMEKLLEHPPPKVSCLTTRWYLIQIFRHIIFGLLHLLPYLSSAYSYWQFCDILWQQLSICLILDAFYYHHFYIFVNIPPSLSLSRQNIFYIHGFLVTSVMPTNFIASLKFWNLSVSQRCLLLQQPVVATIVTCSHLLEWIKILLFCLFIECQLYCNTQSMVCLLTFVGFSLTRPIAPFIKSSK